MKWALVASVLVLSGVASAQSYVESNARDTVCEWKDKAGNKGIDICHIKAMGVHAGGENILMFSIGNSLNVYYLTENETDRTLLIGQGDFWHFEHFWKGTYTDKFISIGDSEDISVSVNVIKMSNGYTIKLVY